MNSRPNLDMMMEATRLTREGRLEQAMAVIRTALGGGGSEAPSHVVNPEAAAPYAILDMVPPSAVSGGAWMPPPFGEAASPRRPETAGRHPKRASDGVLDQLGQLGALRGLEGLIRQAAVRAPAAALPDGARFEERVFANEAGSRAYKLYVPSSYAGQAPPLVVMLHGCTQSPDDFAAGTRMNELAEEQGFLVAYPAQAQSANASKCWNWFKAADQHRDAGEPSLIAGITRQVMRDFAVDAKRVYVAGLSAGGAAAAVLGSAYPDLYAAIGVHSGLACGAASDMRSAFAAMRQGASSSGRQNPTRSIPTIVFHGDRDTTVNPVNGDQVIAQSRPLESLPRTVVTGQSPGGISYTRTVHADASGRAMLEHWAIHGAGHAWSGGSSTGSYTEPRGPDASREMMRFFLQHEKPAFPAS